ncbi:MAG: cytochrome c [Verrucomicrobiae bacterium]|nr:cytochrome c [Verrucomicrobiae bacterium]MCP5550407.1 cytochrome c [Akkermansiaceae bacterium]
MSEDHSSSDSPISKFLSSVLMLGAPAFLLLMLGLTGFFFMANSGDKKAKAEATAASAATPAAATAPAAATPTAPVPAAAPTLATTAAAPAASGPPKGVDAAFWQVGQATFATCAACHGPDGKGLQAGPALMAPTMHGSEILLGDPDGPILVVLKGIAKENMNFMGVMAALGAGLNDEQIAAVLTYVRNSWGNQAAPVTVEQVAAARAKFADVNAPAGVKRAEIMNIVGAHK